MRGILALSYHAGRVTASTRARIMEATHMGHGPDA